MGLIFQRVVRFVVGVAVVMVTGACSNRPVALQPGPPQFRSWDPADARVRMLLNPADTAARVEWLRFGQMECPDPVCAIAKRRALALQLLDEAPEAPGVADATRIPATGWLADPEGAAELQRRWAAVAQATRDPRVFNNAIDFFGQRHPTEVQMVLARAESVAPSPQWSERRGRMWAGVIVGRGPVDTGPYGDGATPERRREPAAMEARANVSASTDPMAVWATADQLLRMSGYIDQELKPFVAGLVERVAAMMPDDVRSQRLSAVYHEYLWNGPRAELLKIAQRSSAELRARLDAFSAIDRIDTMAAVAETSVRTQIDNGRPLEPFSGDLAAEALSMAAGVPVSPALSAALVRAHAVSGLLMLQAGQRAAATEQLSLAAKVNRAPSFAAHETFRAFDLLTYKLLDAGERESVSAALDQMATNADGIDRFATYGRDAADIRSGRMPRSYQVFHEVLSMNERMWARVARARRTSRVSPR